MQLLPIVPEWQSDSGSFDAVLELLVHTGRELPETMVRSLAAAGRQAHVRSHLLLCMTLGKETPLHTEHQSAKTPRFVT